MGYSLQALIYISGARLLLSIRTRSSKCVLSTEVRAVEYSQLGPGGVKACQPCIRLTALHPSDSLASGQLKAMRDTYNSMADEDRLIDSQQVKSQDFTVL